MANVLFNHALDQKLQAMEEKFRSILEQSLSAFLEKPVPVRATGPEALDYKEFKSSLPGEVVVAALTATDGGPGRTLFAFSKSDSAVLADMLLMGDGKAAFSYEEHLEPLRDLCKEVMAAFSADLSKDIGHRVSFEEIKISLVDFTPADFVGTPWIISQLTIGLEPPLTMFRLVSSDFCTACYPDIEACLDQPDADSVEDTEVAEVTKEMGLVLDIELPISIELGRTAMLIRDIIRIAPGSIVELDKLSGEPVDLFVNGRLFAKGEVVVVDENFAVRVTELVAQVENGRMRSN